MGTEFPLDSAKLELIRTAVEPVMYRGQPALHVAEKNAQGEEPRLVVLQGATLRNGTIELEVAGAPGPSANATARGFIGVAFR